METQNPKPYQLFAVNNDITYFDGTNFQSILNKDIRLLPYQCLTQLIFKVNGFNIFKWHLLFGQRLYNFIHNYNGCIVHSRSYYTSKLEALMNIISILEDPTLDPHDADAHRYHLSLELSKFVTFVNKYEQNKNWLLLDPEDTFNALPIVQNLHTPTQLGVVPIHKETLMSSYMLTRKPNKLYEDDDFISPEYSLHDSLIQLLDRYQHVFTQLKKLRRYDTVTESMRHIVPTSMTSRLVNVVKTIPHKVTDKFSLYGNVEFGKKKRSKIIKQERLPTLLRNKPIGSKFVFKGKSIVVKKWGNSKRFIVIS